MKFKHATKNIDKSQSKSKLLESESELNLGK